MKTAEEFLKDKLKEYGYDEQLYEKHIKYAKNDIVRIMGEYRNQSHPTTLPSDEESLKAIRTEIIKKNLHKESYVDGINVFFSYHQAMEEYASAKIAEMEREMKEVRNKTITECKEQLLKQLFTVVHSNGYPTEAIPKSTILSLEALMQTSNTTTP